MPTTFTDVSTATVTPSPSGEPPIGYDQYPRVDDLSVFLEDAPFKTPPSAQRLSAAVLAGIEQVEGRCQRHFLAGRKVDNSIEDVATRVYDPATTRSAASYGAHLDLGPYGDLARLDSVVYQPTNSMPETLILGTDYRPMPQNALARGTPYTYLEMFPRWWSLITSALWGSMAVTGLWGYTTSLPMDVWQAMLSASAISLFSTSFAAAGVPIGIKSWTAPGNVQTVFDTAGFSSRMEQWQTSIDDVVMRYARWSL